MKSKGVKRMRAFVCPECGGIGTLRMIIYGMPDPAEFEFDKHAIGGCCVREDGKEPNIACRACGWLGFPSLFVNDRS